MVIDVRNVGPAPLLAALGREPGIVESINTRLPATCDLAEELIVKAVRKDNWFNLGQPAEGKDNANYRLAEYLEQLDDKSYRFLVVYSSTLDQRKLKNRTTGSRMSKKGWKKRSPLLEPSSSFASLMPRQPLTALL